MKEKAIIISDRIVEYCLYALIFFIPISSTAIEIFASLAILAFIVKKILLPEFEFIKNHTHLFLLLFFAFCALSLINSGPYLKTSLEALFFKWLEYIFIFLIVEDTLTHQKRIRNAMAVLLFMGAVVGIDALFQRFLGWEFLRGRSEIQTRDGIYATAGPFKHYNNFATYLVCILSLGIALLFSGTRLWLRRSQARKITYRTSLFFLILLLGLCLLFTFSRGGWLGLWVAMLLMLFLSRKWKIILPFICIFILAVIFMPAVRERAIFTFQAGGDADRFQCWKVALAMIKENPFLGKGLGTFMANFSLYTRSLFIQYAHNCYLQMWTEIGIFGLLSFLLFVGSILYKGVRVFRDSSLPSTSLGTGRGQSLAILLGLICALFGFLVHSFFDTQLYSLQLSALFWFMLGLAVGIQKAEA
jgi:putative inorganic carbon (HCO3(-)) transporter